MDVVLFRWMAHGYTKDDRKFQVSVTLWYTLIDIGFGSSGRSDLHDEKHRCWDHWGHPQDGHHTALSLAAALSTRCLVSLISLVSKFPAGIAGIGLYGLDPEFSESWCNWCNHHVFCCRPTTGSCSAITLFVGTKVMRFGPWLFIGCRDSFCIWHPSWPVVPGKKNIGAVMGEIDGNRG